MIWPLEFVSLLMKTVWGVNLSGTYQLKLYKAKKKFIIRADCCASTQQIGVTERGFKLTLILINNCIVIYCCMMSGYLTLTNRARLVTVKQVGIIRAPFTPP